MKVSWLLGLHATATWSKKLDQIIGSNDWIVYQPIQLVGLILGSKSWIRELDRVSPPLNLIQFLDPRIGPCNRPFKVSGEFLKFDFCKIRAKFEEIKVYSSFSAMFLKFHPPRLIQVFHKCGGGYVAPPSSTLVKVFSTTLSYSCRRCGFSLSWLFSFCFSSQELTLLLNCTVPGFALFSLCCASLGMSLSCTMFIQYI